MSVFGRGIYFTTHTYCKEDLLCKNNEQVGGVNMEQSCDSEFVSLKEPRCWLLGSCSDSVG